MITRLHLLPILFTLAIINPLTYYVLHTSRTYFWVVPLTLFIWFGFKWNDLEASPDLKRHPLLWEMILGSALIVGIVGRAVLQDPSARIFGLFDMLVLFVALALILFGFHSLRTFWVPAAFLAIIGAGYHLEKAIVDLMGYDRILAGVVAFLSKTLGAQAGSDGPFIILAGAGPSRLLVDYGCTGIKGILAFAFISFIPIIESGRSRGRKAIWLVFAFLGFVAASIMRLVAVVFAVMAWGQVAVDYHTTIGFGFFMAWLILVTYYGSGSQIPSQEPRSGMRRGIHSP